MKRKPRIVSLIASATEIVCGLGYAEYLVGRSHECDYPTDVLQLPCCTAPQFPTEGTSSDINRRVVEIVEKALSVYRVDAGMLEQLQPTHIITQTQCEVCAVSLKDVETAACELISSHPQIISLHADVLSDVFADIERVAVSLGNPASAAVLIDQMKQRMAALADRLRTATSRPPTAFVEWIEPLMPGGNWMPELVEEAGGHNCFLPPADGSASRFTRTFEELVQCAPEVIVVAPCGFGIERTVAEMHWLTQHQMWCELPAVQNNRVCVADGNQYFNRPGPRLVDSLEILAEIIHPEICDFGYRGKAWVPFTAGLATSDTRA